MSRDQSNEGTERLRENLRNTEWASSEFGDRWVSDSDIERYRNYQQHLDDNFLEVVNGQVREKDPTR